MTDFDRHSGTYREQTRRSIAFVGADGDLVLELKADLMVDVMRETLGDPSRAKLLDLGCGIGLMDKLLTGRVGSITGVDVSASSVDEARKANPGISYESYDGARLPFADATFDAVMVVCVMHHVPPSERSVFMSEMARVLRPGGVAVVFEHNPLNPLTRVVVNRCELDRDAVLLTQWETAELGRRAGLRVAEVKSILYFPWRGSVFRRIESALGWLPLGGQYFVALTK